MTMTYPKVYTINADEKPFPVTLHGNGELMSGVSDLADYLGTSVETVMRRIGARFTVMDDGKAYIPSNVIQEAVNKLLPGDHSCGKPNLLEWTQKSLKKELDAIYIAKPWAEEERIENALDLSDSLPIMRRDMGEEETSAVETRKVHAWLGETTPFLTWIQKALEEDTAGKFVKGVDYCDYEDINDGTVKKYFMVSLDLAKQLAMMSKTEKGFQARDYFIRCERALNRVCSKGMGFLADGALFTKAMQEMFGDQQEYLINAFSQYALRVEDRIDRMGATVEIRLNMLEDSISTQVSEGLTRVSQQMMEGFSNLIQIRPTVASRRVTKIDTSSWRTMTMAAKELGMGRRYTQNPECISLAAFMESLSIIYHREGNWKWFACAGYEDKFVDGRISPELFEELKARRHPEIPTEEEINAASEEVLNS